MPELLRHNEIRQLISGALAEDVGSGDLTTGAIVPRDTPGTGVFLTKAPVVVAGLEIAREVFTQIDPEVVWESACTDGSACLPGDVIATVSGRAASLLIAERTALNFLQYLSGIATITREFVAASGGTIQILDTRKTAPGLRSLAKYAVRCGGGVNHRTGLYDGILIKDNHIRIAGGIAEAVRRVRGAGITLPIEVEAQSEAQVEDALAAGADIIMLDNLDDEMMRRAIEAIGGRARVEISGGITLSRVRAIARLGADCVSVGALTHSSHAADISLEIETATGS